MAYVGNKEQHRRWLIFLLKMYQCQVPSISLLACRAVGFFFFHGNQQFISVAEACHLYASPFCLDFSLNFLLKNINIFIYIYIYFTILKLHFKQNLYKSSLSIESFKMTHHKSNPEQTRISSIFIDHKDTILMKDITFLHLQVNSI